MGSSYVVGREAYNATTVLEQKAVSRVSCMHALVENKSDVFGDKCCTSSKAEKACERKDVKDYDLLLYMKCR